MTTLIKNYENLANAIITQAVEDYRKALRRKTDRDRHTVFECEKFFRSEYFQILTNFDGETLISKIKGELQCK